MMSPVVLPGLLVVAGALLASVAVQAQLPAFPGADGAGAYVTGGRGGIVYHVTRLDQNYGDSMEGTLRYGLNDSNFPDGVPRTIVFDVGGTFWLGRFGAEKGHNNGWDTQSRLNLGSNLTIAGQTAPGGVVIMGGLVKAGGRNIILRNVTIAPGYGMRKFAKPEDGIPPSPGTVPDSYTYDAIDITGRDMIIDHVTAVYATDETISANEFADNITIQYCNISQGQNYPQADAEASGVTYTGHALGSLLQGGSASKISVLNNLYAHQKGRLPRVGSEVGSGALNDFRNNVFFNWLGTAGGGASGQLSFNNFINNFYLAGNGGDDPVGGNSTAITTRLGGTGIFNGRSATSTKVFKVGNLKDVNRNGDPGDVLPADGDFASSGSAAPAHGLEIGVTLEALEAFTNVLRHVGARWWERNFDFSSNNVDVIDTVDERIIHETFTGEGKILAWADDPFNADPSEGVEWRSLLALRADTATGNAPFARSSDWDTDRDGMPDHWELKHGLPADEPNSNEDFDSDGFTDLEEYLNEIAAWPAPGVIRFEASHGRYAELANWRVHGAEVVVPRVGAVPTSLNWQPSQFDTAVINDAIAVVDSVGQHAGVVRLENGAALQVSSGWLEVAERLEINGGTVALSGGILQVSAATMGLPGSAFNFTDGTLSAGSVEFDLVCNGGTISPRLRTVGLMQVGGNLVLEGASTIEMDLGGLGAGESDQLRVDGDLHLNGVLNLRALPGFGVGTYTLMEYSGVLEGAMTIGETPSGYQCRLDTGMPGLVRVVVAHEVRIDAIELIEDRLVIRGQGPANQPYRLQTTHVIHPSEAQWKSIATNTFGMDGRFSETNSFDASNAGDFFRISVP